MLGKARGSAAATNFRPSRCRLFTDRRANFGVMIASNIVQTADAERGAASTVVLDIPSRKRIIDDAVLEKLTSALSTQRVGLVRRASGARNAVLID